MNDHSHETPNEIQRDSNDFPYYMIQNLVARQANYQVGFGRLDEVPLTADWRGSCLLAGGEKRSAGI